MGIFSRLSDVVNSNIHAMLDRAQDPEKMVRLIIQEMEDTLVEVRSASVRSLARKKEVHRAVARLEAEAADWQSKAELAVSRDRDDLARGALAARNRVQTQLESHSRELEQLEEDLSKLDSDTRRLRAKLDDARARQKTIALRQQSAGTRVKAQGKLHDDRIEDAMVRMEEYENRIEHLEAKAESFSMGAGKLQNELEELAREDEFAEELADMRNRLRSASSDETHKQS